MEGKFAWCNSVHHFKVSAAFWKCRVKNYDYVCVVDGAFGLHKGRQLKGGIEGFILNKRKEKILIFFGPIEATSALKVELEGILRMLQWVIELGKHEKRVLICTDSMESINIFNKGYATVYPLKNCDFLFQHLIVSNVLIQFVPSELNEEADLLVKQEIEKQIMSTWQLNTSFST